MIIVNLDVMMAKRKIGLTELAGIVGITNANLSILKNNNLTKSDRIIANKLLNDLKKALGEK